MRIAFISDEVSGFHTGGIGTYIVEAGHALTAAGHEAWLITEPPSEERREEMRRIQGFSHVRFVDECAAAKGLPTSLFAGKARRFAQLAHATLLETKQQFDYVEFADYGAAGSISVPEQRWFRSLGDAVVAIALHSPTHDCLEFNQTLHYCSLYHREIIALEHETLRLANNLWSPSARLREMVADRLGLDSGTIPLIRYPMREPPPAEPLKPKERLEDLRFCFFGRIEPRKGVRQIVDAWAKMPHLEIDCFGRDGPTSPVRSSEVAYLQRRGVGNVKFHGNLARDEAVARVRNADVVVLPSPWDNWPNACIEAMAAGRVVIGGRNGGMGEMIEHGVNGFLVDGSDPDDLRRVVEQDLRAALPDLPRIGANAARRARQLSRPQDYVRSIEAFVAERKPPRRATSKQISKKVSVVIPYYGEPRQQIHAAVASAIAQTHSDLEILLVDDGSVGPDVGEILREAESMDPRVRVHRKQNGGLASARNHGIAQSKGDFLIMLDADNLLRPDYAATALDVLAQEPDAVAAIPALQAFADADGKPDFVSHPLPYDPGLWLARNSLGDAGAMFRKTVFSEHGLRYDSAIDCYADWALWLDIQRKGLRTIRVPRVLYDYRIRKDSMSATRVWDQHLPMIAHLAEHHWPSEQHDGCKALVETLCQAWGVGALVLSVRSDLASAERQLETTRRATTEISPPPRTLRHSVAFAIGNAADRWPRLGNLGRRLVRGALSLHGKWKDLRSGKHHDDR